ncbi:MAG: hypothetical protein FWF85_06685 [Clostridiales bacterium]|jgi:hypothetical protein|nr:hypothetical protein [Clostridiales bacterium]MDR2712519.1 hypothetical protein [Clostridiales bacterium]
MLVAFQGFTAPPDGKKTGAGVANLCALGYSHWAYADIIEASIGHLFEHKENGKEIWIRELADIIMSTLKNVMHPISFSPCFARPGKTG